VECYPRQVPSGAALGESIVTLRRCLGLSREELAGQLGVDESKLRDWEHGKKRPLKRNLKRVEAVLDSLMEYEESWDGPRS
jgi:DNA-binding transcriptional regulator YiaG